MFCKSDCPVNVIHLPYVAIEPFQVSLRKELNFFLISFYLNFKSFSWLMATILGSAGSEGKLSAPNCTVNLMRARTFFPVLLTFGIPFG